jgi:regulatory protein
MKQWGRQKIKFELKGRKVSDYNIKKGLSEIDPFEYEHTMNRLLDKKIAELQQKARKTEIQRKVYSYMIQKGYERDIVIDMLNDKLKTEKK